MAILLHILTKPDDTLARELVSAQSAQPENRVEVVDLTQPQPDYTVLVEKIFAADSVAVW
jgi:hypothetical protein